jgi:penicillin-binding protein 1B
VEVDDATGAAVWSSPVTAHPVLDPRVSYLMVSLLESVINGGTAAGVRARGFRLPAAGKTGTSHDGWFAGFTSNLLAVVWVGYDDDRQLNLTGAQSALPFWTEFMKRATSLPSYRNAEPFKPPSGIVTAPIEIQANSAGSPDLPTIQNEIFIQGTQPPLGELPRGIQVAEEGPNPEAPTTDAPPQEGQQGDDPAPSLAVIPLFQSPVAALQAEKATPKDPPAENAPSGELRIQTDPQGLEVFVDGKSVGSSPVDILVSVGEHTYKIVPPPGKTQLERTFQMRATEIKTVKIVY